MHITPTQSVAIRLVKAKLKLYLSTSYPPNQKTLARVTNLLWPTQYSYYHRVLCLRSTSNSVHFSNRHLQILKLEILQSFHIVFLAALEWNQYLLTLWRTKSPKSLKKKPATCSSESSRACPCSMAGDYGPCGRQQPANMV